MKRIVGWVGLLMVLGCLAPGVHATSSPKVTVQLIITNAQGSVVAKMTPDGVPTYSADYRPYGTTQSTPQAGPGYTGHVMDPTSGLVYMQQRYYDPATGRFISPDPVAPTPGNVFNFGKYTYANNNPVVNTDPDGRSPWSSPAGPRDGGFISDPSNPRCQLNPTCAFALDAGGKAKPSPPKKMKVLWSRTEDNGINDNYFYQIMGTKGDALTGSGYWVKEINQVVLHTKYAPKNKSNPNWVHARNGVIMDSVGLHVTNGWRGVLPANIKNSESIVHQHFIVWFKGKTYPLTTVLKHKIIVNGEKVVKKSTKVYIP